MPARPSPSMVRISSPLFLERVRSDHSWRWRPSPIEFWCLVLTHIHPTAYMAACNLALNTTLDTTNATLAVPPTWDGSFGQGLDIGGTVVTVIAGTILGGGLIGVLCTM